jgi:hypothetical protein
LDIPRLPLLVDCLTLRNYLAFFTGLLKAQTPDLSSLQRNLDAILEEGLALIILENVSSVNKEQNAFISQMMERFHRNQFILIVRSSFSGEIDSLLDLKFPGVADTLHIQPYSRSLVREFIRKSNPPLRGSEDVALDQIISRFRQLGLPLTPVYLSLLFRIFEQDVSFQPTNTASLVENFVERVLNKASLDARREVFDYKNRVGLLAYFAQEMIEKDTYLVDFTEIYSWTKSYLTTLGFDEDIQGLVKSFYDARIFSFVGNSVQFRQDMFLAYFAAQRMIIKAEFAKKIIKSAERFRQEIDIYCGLKRFDDGVLDTLAAKFKNVDERLRSRFPKLPELASVDGLELPKDKSIESMFASVTEQLVGKKLTDIERDKLLEPETSPASGTHMLARPEVESVAMEWITTLRAYTVALKNLEEVDLKKKAENLRIILEAWSRAIGYLIMLIRITFEVEIDFGGVTMNLDKIYGEFKPVILRSLLVTAPSLISGLLRNDLGTEKHRVILSAMNPANGNESVTVRFLNEALYADLRLPEFIRRIDALSKAIGGRQFFGESLLVKLLESYVRFPVKEEVEDREYRRIMAALNADIAGKRGAERDGFIAMQLQAFKRQQIVSTLKQE